MWCNGIAVFVCTLLLLLLLLLLLFCCCCFAVVVVVGGGGGCCCVAVPIYMAGKCQQDLRFTYDVNKQSGLQNSELHIYSASDRNTCNES